MRPTAHGCSAISWLRERPCCFEFQFAMAWSASHRPSGLVSVASRCKSGPLLNADKADHRPTRSKKVSEVTLASRGHYVVVAAVDLNHLPLQ